MTVKKGMRGRAGLVLKSTLKLIEAVRLAEFMTDYLEGINKCIRYSAEKSSNLIHVVSSKKLLVDGYPEPFNPFSELPPSDLNCSISR